jgi:hypothetical protein
VWAPIGVSLALVGFGLAMAGRYGAGLEARAGRLPIAGLLVGGLVVIGSFTLNAGVVLDGGIPTAFAWPIYALGMGIGIVSAWAIMGTAVPGAAAGHR